MAERARDWAIWLTRFARLTGSDGERDLPAALAAKLRATPPARASGVRSSGEVIGTPTVNIGPWGRDYHTPLERVETRHALETLPCFLLEVAHARLAQPRTA
jgi:arginine utilization protein RocB